jgi:hypothetical protein
VLTWLNTGTTLLYLYLTEVRNEIMELIQMAEDMVQRTFLNTAMNLRVAEKRTGRDGIIYCTT